MRLGGFVRVATTVVSLAVAVTVLAGCAEPAPVVPLEPLEGSSSTAQAEEQADRLVLLLTALEERFALEPMVEKVGLGPTLTPTPTPTATSVFSPSPIPQYLSATATVDEAPIELSSHFYLATQARSFLAAHAAYLEDCASASLRPASIDVTATDVEVVGTDPNGDPVARVVIETTYHYLNGVDSKTSVEYALSWSPGVGGGVDAQGKPAQGPHFDGVRLAEILPMYDDAGQPALDSGLGKASPVNAVHGYIQALTHGSSANITAMEGTVRSSEDFRALLKDRLKSAGRYSVAEVPGARMGNMHVLFVIQDGVPGALRLDVTIGPDGPTVVPRL